MIYPGSNQVCVQISPVDEEGTRITKAPWLETGLDLVYTWAVVVRVRRLSKR